MTGFSIFHRKHTDVSDDESDETVVGEHDIHDIDMNDCRDGLCGHLESFETLTDVIFDKDYEKGIKKAEKQTTRVMKHLNELREEATEIKEYTQCSVCHAKIDTVVQALELSHELIKDIRDNLPEREALKLVLSEVEDK